MNHLFMMDRKSLRRRSVPAFVREIAQKHPELREPVTYSGFLAIAAREEVTVRFLPLSRPARLIRVGDCPCIQLNRRLTRNESAVFGMHEMCHFWRDDPGEPCYNAEDNALADAQEEFADIFAWVVTSSARIFLPGLRDEDF